jgi:hypothetical protein
MVMEEVININTHIIVVVVCAYNAMWNKNRERKYEREIRKNSLTHPLMKHNKV